MAIEIVEMAIENNLTISQYHRNNLMKMVIEIVDIPMRHGD